MLHGEILATLRCEERLRPGAASEVVALRAAGYDLHLLSGDAPAKVAAMAAAGPRSLMSLYLLGVKNDEH